MKKPRHKKGGRALLVGTLAAGMGIVLFNASVSGDQAAPFDEYDVKVELVYKLPKLMYFSGNYDDACEHVHLAIVGRHRFEDRFVALRGRSLLGAPVIVEYHKALDTVDPSCTIVFFGEVSVEELAEALPELQRNGILTFTESDALYQAGVIVQLINVGDQVRFRINRASGEKSGIDFQAQLLKLADETR